MKLVTVSELDILRKICKLRKKAASGPERILLRILQQLDQSFLLPLKLLFNKTLRAGKVPSEWKHADIQKRHEMGSR